MILNHLRGVKDDCTDVISTYPLFPDNTCRFLVFDFDNHEKDAYKNDDADIYDNLIRIENEQAAAELLEITEKMMM